MKDVMHPLSHGGLKSSGQVRAVSVAWEETGIMWIGGVTAVYHTKIVSEYHLYSVDACGA